MTGTQQYTVPIGKESNNKRALTDTAYVKALHPDSGPRDVVIALAHILPSGASVFEYGVGPGKNVFYLMEHWYKVHGQDISDEMIRILYGHARERGVTIRIEDCSAQDFVPEKIYDAFVCTYVLHFILRQDALKVIKTMQEYTCPGGYNALTMFSAEWSHASDRHFYVIPEEIKELYAGWTIHEEKTWDSVNAQNHASVNLTLLLQKPL